MKVIILSLAGIGDTILGSSIIREIKERYGEFDILLFPYGAEELYKEYAKNIYLFEDFTHTKTSQKPSIFRIIKTFFMLLKLRKNKYDLSISLYPSSSPKLAKIAKFINAKRRIGFEHFHYTDPIYLNTKIHRFECNLDLLKPLNIQIKNPKQFIPLIKENEKFAEDFLKDKGKLFVGMHVGGYWKTNLKSWDFENFAKLADLICKDFGAQILIFEGPSDDRNTEKRASLMKYEPIKVKTDLGKTASILKKCKLMISNDTGLMHLAEAVEIPVIDIGGWTDWNAGPYLKTNKLFISQNLPCYENCWIRKTGGKEGKFCNLECFKQIKVEEVYETVKKILKNDTL